MNVERTKIRIYADPKKVLLRYLNFGLNPDRINPIVDYVLSLTEEELKKELASIKQEFGNRHFNLDKKMLENFETLSAIITKPLSGDQKLLVGAYFTHEYSAQAAALFNPSIVAHPNQSQLKKGEIRFILSLRSTGEGHISSISFQTGIISDEGEVIMDPAEQQISEGEIRENGSSYEIEFDKSIPLSSRVIFPYLSEESMGMEDVRFVHIQGSNYDYAGTYTAYNGQSILPKVILTNDFRKFEIRRFEGESISNKGLAFFPRKINEKYAIIGRQGGRNLSIMYSNDLLKWDDYSLLQKPEMGWEMLQIGNNGSPIETESGWLLLTHGVGPMRKYTLGISLLDLDDPSKVISILTKPLLSPNEEEREGYVPNVVYTCGMLEHNGVLYIPYAMSDHAISFAKVKTQEVLDELLKTNEN